MSPLHLIKSGILSLSVIRLSSPAMSGLWDYENWLLSRYDLAFGMPVGLGRLTHEPWVQHVKKDLPNSDFTWEQYKSHVEKGDGDDWFLESPDDPAADQ